MLLLDLPEDVGRVILSSWLKLVDYGRIDVAINPSNCNAWRKLLSLLPTLSPNFQIYKRMPVSLNRWCYNRNVLLENITISDFWFNKNGALKGNINWSSIRHLNIICTKRKQMFTIDSALRHYNPNLTGLSALSLNAFYQMNMPSRVRLISLTIKQKDHREATFALPIIATNCELLQYLSIDFKNSRHTYTDLCVDIVEVNPDLKFIKLPSELAIAFSIADSCKAIENVELFNADMDLLAFQTLCSLPTVQSIELTSGNLYRRLEDGKRNLKLLEIPSGDAHCNQYITSLRDYSSIEVFLGHVSEDDARRIISQSATTLEELQLPSSGVYSGSVVRNAIFQCTRLTSLHWNERNGNIFDLCHPSFQLKKLWYNSMSMSVVKIIIIIHFFPLLEMGVFSRIEERSQDIFAFKEFIYRYGVDHPKFQCDVYIGNNGSVLRYKDGRFSGKSAIAYLSDIERELLLSDVW